MKSLAKFLLSACFLLAVTACTALAARTATPSPPPAGPSVRGVFQGNTPCSSRDRPLPHIPDDSDCEQLIWSLAFFQDPETGAPTTYTLDAAYGLPKQGTNDLIMGGTPIVMEGKWAAARGTKMDPEAEIYQLNPDDPQTSVSFLKVSDDLLHVLDKDGALLVGNGSWSYTLNRTDNRVPVQVSGSPGPPPEATRPPVPPAPAGSSVFGVFDGRTPCHEIVLAFTKTAPYSGCAKIKWRLTLYQDEATGAPSAYLYMGTRDYREGTWTVVRGAAGDPGHARGIIYQLQPDASQEPVSFLAVDENHLYLLDRSLNFLVGDALFSYTLSRTP